MFRPLRADTGTAPLLLCHTHTLQEVLWQQTKFLWWALLCLTARRPLWSFLKAKNSLSDLMQQGKRTQGGHKCTTTACSKNTSTQRVSLWLLTGVISVRQSVCVCVSETNRHKHEGCRAFWITTLPVCHFQQKLTCYHPSAGKKKTSPLSESSSMFKYLRIKSYDNILIVCGVITHLTRLFN